jgi:hypothetical protein
MEEKRIEINAVRNIVGSELFWEWIVSQLEELFPARDYNRAIGIPLASDFTPLLLEKLNNVVEGKIAGVLTPLIEGHEEKLSDYHGFMNNVRQYEIDLFDEFQDKIDEDGDMGPIMKDISKIVYKYRN